MLKYVLLGAAMTVTVPALAQTSTTPAPTTVTPAQSAPMTATPQAEAAPRDPTQAAQTEPAMVAPTETAAAEPAAKPADIASVVDSEFATYDKDADGKLNQAEFGTWMVALKSQTDPKTDANSPATKKWNKTAFAQADTDKSKSLTKAELAGFLAPAKAS